MTQKSLSAEEIAKKHGLPTYDPIQWYHIKNAMEEYASQKKEKEEKLKKELEKARELNRQAGAEIQEQDITIGELKQRYKDLMEIKKQDVDYYAKRIVELKEPPKTHSHIEEDVEKLAEDRINAICLCFMENINVNSGTTWSQMLSFTNEILNAAKQTK